MKRKAQEVASVKAPKKRKSKPQGLGAVYHDHLVWINELAKARDAFISYEPPVKIKTAKSSVSPNWELTNRKFLGKAEQWRDCWAEHERFGHCRSAGKLIVTMSPLKEDHHEVQLFRTRHTVAHDLLFGVLVEPLKLGVDYSRLEKILMLLLDFPIRDPKMDKFLYCVYVNQSEVVRAKFNDFALLEKLQHGGQDDVAETAAALMESWQSPPEMKLAPAECLQRWYVPTLGGPHSDVLGVGLPMQESSWLLHKHEWLPMSIQTSAELLTAEHFAPEVPDMEALLQYSKSHGPLHWTYVLEHMHEDKTLLRIWKIFARLLCFNYIEAKRFEHWFRMPYKKPLAGKLVTQFYAPPRRPFD